MVLRREPITASGQEVTKRKIMTETYSKLHIPQTDDFRVLQIDHVELFVPDRYEAARWYEQVLGLSIVPECEHWAGPGGPLMISSDGGRTKLALFEGEPRRSRRTAGHHRVAFRVDGNAFFKFLSRIQEFLYTATLANRFSSLRSSTMGRRSQSTSGTPMATDMRLRPTTMNSFVPIRIPSRSTTAEQL